jgi:hypothetical protein
MGQFLSGTRAAVAKVKKQKQHEIDHSPPSTAEIRMSLVVLTIPPLAFIACTGTTVVYSWCVYLPLL